MSLNEETISFGENEIRQKRNQERLDWRRDVKEIIRAGNIEVERGDIKNYINLVNIIRDYAWGYIIEAEYTKSLEEYHMELDDSDYTWDWLAIQMFKKNNLDYIDILQESSTSINNTLNGELAPRTEAREYTKRCFRSLESIVEYEGIIKKDMRNRADALGFDHKIGVHRQSYEMDLSDKVRIISDETGNPKTLFLGGTGQGKSAGKYTEVVDRYNAGYKILDLIDTDKFENIMYDVPQSDNHLIRIREDMDLAPDFTHDDNLKEPDLEVYHPLTQGVEDKTITENKYGESIIRWFTIPASEISKTVFGSMMGEMLTDQQSSDIMSAYDSVDNAKDDWTLADLAEEIRESTIEEAVKARIIQKLDQLQSSGFIRDKSCPYAIDLDDIMMDTEVITSFSQAYIRDEASRLFVIAWLVDKVYSMRRWGPDYPKAAVVLSEMHEIVPHNRKTSADSLAEALQKGPLRSRIGKLQLKGRHYDTEVLADTQKSNHLNKNIKEEFNRYVVYNLGQSKLQNLFDYAEGVDKDSYKKCSDTLTLESGVAAVVGVSEPVVNNREIDFISPVKYAPPAHHHIDTDVHSDGWNARSDLLDENKTTPDIDPTLPDKYDIDQTNTDPDTYTPSTNPLGSFAERCLVETDDPNDALLTKEVRDIYSEYADKHDLPHLEENKSSFGKDLRKYIDVERSERSKGYVYLGLKISTHAKTQVLS